MLLNVVVPELLLAVEHRKGVGDAVVGQRDRADGLGQAHGFVERTLVDVASGGVSARAAHVDLVVQLGEERLGVDGGTTGAHQAGAACGVGGNAQIKAMKKVASSVKLELAQYRELASFSQFGSDVDADTKARLDNGQVLMEILKQPQYQPIPVEKQVMIIYAV